MLLNEDLTQMLLDWNEGDESALERLTPLIYDELRRRAASYLQRERDADTLQATALVHEAYLQVLNFRNIRWQSRVHFINTITMLMRRVLVDHARERNAQKRGSGVKEISLSHVQAGTTEKHVDLVDLNDALERLSAVYPRQAHVVELKFFGGLTVNEITDVMSASWGETSVRTVERDWTFAKTWLHREMKSF